MREPIDRIAHGPSVQAVLHGGPADLPDPLRTCWVRTDDDKVKVPWHGGYEHFERDTATTPGGRNDEIVFRWTTRTRFTE